MRPFVRRYCPRLLGLSTGSEGGYYPNSKSSHHMDQFPRNEIPKSTNGSHQYSTSFKGEPDNGSEEHILGEIAAASPLDGIIQTFEFDVENWNSAIRKL